MSGRVVWPEPDLCKVGLVWIAGDQLPTPVARPTTIPIDASSSGALNVRVFHSRGCQPMVDDHAFRLLRRTCVGVGSRLGSRRLFARRLLLSFGIDQQFVSRTEPGCGIVLSSIEQTIGWTHGVDMADRARLLDIGVHDRKISEEPRGVTQRKALNPVSLLRTILSAPLVVAVDRIWTRPILDRVTERQ